MTEQEFQMNLLIGGWIKTTPEDNSRHDVIYTHNDSIFSLGTKEGMDKVGIYQNGKYLGARQYEIAYTEVNNHMILMCDLAKGA